MEQIKVAIVIGSVLLSACHPDEPPKTGLVIAASPLASPSHLPRPVFEGPMVNRRAVRQLRHGEWIVYGGPQDGIWAIDLALAETINLVRGRGNSASPSWSPAGDAIAFSYNYRDGLRSIFILELDTGSLRRVTQGSEDVEPSWSPDGNELAFERIFTHHSSPDSRYIYRIAVDGSKLRRVAGRGRDQFGAPRWSPSGGRLVFTEGVYGQLTIWSSGIDGGDLTRLVRPTDTVWFQGPKWSPDGRRLVLVRAEATSEYDIEYELCLMEMPGGTPDCLGVSGENPNWSPDGDRLVFQRGHNLYIYDLVTGTETRLTHDKPYEISPDWQKPKENELRSLAALLCLMTVTSCAAPPDEADRSHQRPVAAAETREISCVLYQRNNKDWAGVGGAGPTRTLHKPAGQRLVPRPAGFSCAHYVPVRSRFRARLAGRRGRVRGHSVETELVALDVLHHEA